MVDHVRYLDCGEAPSPDAALNAPSQSRQQLSRGYRYR
jgi:hypothetical protein